jgi:hypothetical protein
VLAKRWTTFVTREFGMQKAYWIAPVEVNDPEAVKIVIAESV